MKIIDRRPKNNKEARFGDILITKEGTNFLLATDEYEDIVLIDLNKCSRYDSWDGNQMHIFRMGHKINDEEKYEIIEIVESERVNIVFE